MLRENPKNKYKYNNKNPNEVYIVNGSPIQYQTIKKFIKKKTRTNKSIFQCCKD